MLRVASMTSVLVLAVAGCVDVAGDDGSETEVAQALANCQSGFCPKNSPVIATYPFHELSLLGSPNAQGFAISKFLKGTNAYKLSVVDGRISGQSATGAISGQQLVGTQLWVKKSTKEYVIRITGVTPVRMWAKLDPLVLAPQIEGYLLDWTDVIGGKPVNEWKNVCAAAMLPSDTDDLLGAPSFLSFVFEGERINPTKKIISGFSTSWFNVGCAGHLLAKMYLTGHVEAAYANGYKTTLAERQTIMKMFSADYCGTGYAFTVPGIDLQWQDHKKWMAYPGPQAALDLEARWTSSGPVCLDVPRLKAHPTADSTAVLPDVELAISQLCTRPKPCASGDVQYFDGAHLVTANP